MHYRSSPDGGPCFLGSAWWAVPARVQYGGSGVVVCRVEIGCRLSCGICTCIFDSHRCRLSMQ